MGLFVVATLAKRHDIRIRLRSADRGGLVATVVVPAGLVVAHPTPRPEPLPAREPEPEPEPKVDETLALPVIPDSTRRAPVEGEQALDWPSEDNDGRYYLEDDQPTERMPAYQEVLSQWFHTGEHWPANNAGVAEQEQPEDPEWPAADDVGSPTSGQLNGTYLVDEAPRTSPRRPHQSRPNVVDSPDLRLDAEAVRGRMARLQDGFARAREAHIGTPEETG
jgi:hypothetical protein